MWQGFCIAWIVGISLMGIPTGWFNHSLILCCLAIILILLSYFFISASFLKRSIITFLLIILGINAGYKYANHQLEHRLQFRENNSYSSEIIVYISHLNQLNTNAIQQKAEVLSGYRVANPSQQAIYWHLNLPYKSKNSHLTTSQYQDNKDKISDDSTEQQNSATLALGKYYRLTGTVLPQHSYATLGAFDSEKWNLQQNILANFKVKSISELSASDLQNLGLNSHHQQQQQWHKAIALHIEQYRLNIREYIIHQPFQHKGLILALLTGDKSLLDSSTEQQFMRLGISHLLAISGPHVLILAMLVVWLSNKLIIRFYPNLFLKIARPYALSVPFMLCVLFYTAFVGFEIPAVRTLLMSMSIVILLLLNRRLTTFNILLISASCLLWLDPFSVLSASFWLSYGASFILLRIYQSIGQNAPLKTEQDIAQQSLWDKSKMWLRHLIESQWKIFIALFPLVMIFFQKFSIIAPIVNIVAIPILSVLVVPLNIVASIIYAVMPSLATLLWHLVDVNLSLFNTILNTFDQLNHWGLIAVAMQTSSILCLIFAIVILFLPKGILPKTWLIITLIALTFAHQKQSKFELHILDIGQGQAIFLRSQDYKALIDTGGYYDESRFSIGQNVVVPFLLTQGVSHLNEVILSHLDNDHSGALPFILKEISTHKIWANEDFSQDELMHNIQQQRKQKIELQRCAEGQQWHISDHAKITVLSPYPNIANHIIQQDRNEYSCVLYVELKQTPNVPYHNFLIMGDAGWATEKYLLQRYPHLSVDVLVVGHHGSKHSSSEEFIAHYKPKLAIASAGFNNRYAHPHQEVVDIFAKYQIPFISTIENGTIAFKWQNNQLIIDTQRSHKKWLNRTTMWQSQSE